MTNLINSDNEQKGRSGESESENRTEEHRSDVRFGDAVVRPLPQHCPLSLLIASHKYLFCSFFSCTSSLLFFPLLGNFYYCYYYFPKSIYFSLSHTLLGAARSLRYAAFEVDHTAHAACLAAREFIASRQGKIAAHILAPVHFYLLFNVIWFVDLDCIFDTLREPRPPIEDGRAREAMNEIDKHFSLYRNKESGLCVNSISLVTFLLGMRSANIHDEQRFVVPSLELPFGSIDAVNVFSKILYLKKNIYKIKLC